MTYLANIAADNPLASLQSACTYRIALDSRAGMMLSLRTMAGRT